MTEEEALERVSAIGSAFANDLNDGDDPIAYEGHDVTWVQGHAFLSYSATMEDGTEVQFRWIMIPVAPAFEREFFE